MVNVWRALNPAVPYSHGDDLLALMDHLSMAEAALVGLSFGGRIVAEGGVEGGRLAWMLSMGS